MDELTQSITLRPFTLSDAEDMMVWTTDEKVAKFCGYDTTANASKDYVTKQITDRIIPHPYFRAICIDNRPIGSISLKMNTGWESCRAEIGYVIGSDYWGKGIVTKAVKMVISKIFDEFPSLERIEGTVDVDNGASQRVLDKCGFKREGILRKYMTHKGKTFDMIMFSLLDTDPRVL